MEQVYDVLENIPWRYMSYDDILSYCNTNRRMRQVCNDSNTWKYLLHRDYSVESTTDDPRMEYESAKLLDEELEPKIRKNDHLSHDIAHKLGITDNMEKAEYENMKLFTGNFVENYLARVLFGINYVISYLWNHLDQVQLIDNLLNNPSMKRLLME